MGYSPQVDSKCQFVVDTSMELRAHCRDRKRRWGEREEGDEGEWGEIT